MPALPEKLDLIIKTKEELKSKINQTGQNTEVPFRRYSDLISNIPDTGAMTRDDVNSLAEFTLEINGEKA